ncbi:MAG: phosphotransferase, partial [Solirubrobacteraceae bacterium]
PALVAADGECLVAEWLPGAPIDGDRLRADPSSAARALRAFHDSGLRLPVRFWVPDLLDSYAEIIARRDATLPGDYRVAQALVARIAAVLPLAEPVPCHDDLLPGNVLAADADPGRAVLVDWEYAGMGHRLFDLANLAVNNEFETDSQSRLIEAYFEVPVTPGRVAALRLMMLVSDAREAAWGVLQRSISALEFDFDDYATRHFTRMRRGAADPRLERWLDGATA